MTQTAPYGSWRSPISAELAAGASMTFTGLAVDGDDLYWCETRPSEGGRSVLMRRDTHGTLSECTPPEYDIRTGVHEYGGGAFTVSRGTVFFTHAKDQRLYRLRPGEEPHCITPQEGCRYADFLVDHARNRLLCIREDHRQPGEPINSIVAIDLERGGFGVPLVNENDFYSNPRLSPDGSRLAFLTWNHPNMPWDGCEVHVASLNAEGTITEDRLIAGSSTDAIFQPEWSPDGALHFVSEETGWWNLYRWDGAGTRALCPMQAEFGRAMWLFGYATYGFAADNRIFCCFTENGMDKLAWLDPSSGNLAAIPSAWTEIDFVRCNANGAAFVGGAPTLPYTVAWMELQSAQISSVRSALEVTVDEGYISIPQDIELPTSGGRSTHVLYYGPKNRDFMPPPDERPPVIVLGHGGPTSAASTSLRYAIQYWTSRGFGIADVNYGGSTGYGRDYRRSLNGQWGVVDVDDCCTAALELAEKGLADPRRLIIKGRSAGGFTAFACLVFRSEVFAAGISHCGVADLRIFTRDTHKFESHYLETLVGPYPARQDLYDSRSPIHFTGNLRCPLILFQGDQDKVVPPEQSLMMFEAVRAKGIPSAHLVLEGEGHVFRKAETWRRVHEAELYFLSRVFGFPLGDAVESIPIENLVA